MPFTLMRYRSLIKSSLHDIRCCDEIVTVVDGVSTAWRALPSSVSCVQVDDVNTGYAHVLTLEQYNSATSVATGLTKANLPSDPDYIADYVSTFSCPLPIPTGNLYAINNSNLDMSLNFFKVGTADYNHRDITPNHSVSVDLPFGTYDVTILCNVVQPPSGPTLHMQCNINGVTKIINNGSTFHFSSVTLPIDINVHPTISSTN
ncbi:hypothetical protein [Mucilaginibacter sp. 10B2]|uniref:hypothetical protein n=1 Tax=Mucilaginibacter sp. 10B2 TaxID=3048574 RepID=UPI002B22AEC2|nr:hypothetical protein [Mucilaginibacter sp. 10B2]MEB0278961.1 hypothetical protein [Mucilaginibacter sp. 10B2]